MSRSKARGTAFERLLADGFAAALDDDRIDRAVMRGSADRGDLTPIRSQHGLIIIEAKNVKRQALAEWVGEAQAEAGNADALAGFVVHKRRGKGQFQDQYVTSTVRELLAAVWGVQTEARP